MKTLLNTIFILFISVFAASQEMGDSLFVIHQFDLYFENADDELDSIEYQRLVSAIDSLGGVAYDSIFISGHTDTKGSPEYNLKLSKRRVLTVLDLLKSLDGKEEQIRASHYGEQKLYKKELSEDDRKWNRRVNVRYCKNLKVAKLKGYLIDDSLDLSGVTIIAENRIFKDSTWTDEKGNFEMMVPFNQLVKISQKSEELFGIARMIKTDRKFFLEPLELKTYSINDENTLDLEDLFFIGDSPRLLPKSIPVVQNIGMSLCLNPNVCFEIGGHVNAPFQAPDFVGSHFSLSVNRAKTIERHFSRHIDTTRFYIHGYSNSAMKFPEARTNEEMAANRRVEITVKDCEEVRRIKSIRN